MEYWKNINRQFNNSKNNNFKDYFLPILSLIISAITAIGVFVINSNTNQTLKELNDRTNITLTNLKQYEINYVPKRESYTSLIILLQKTLEEYNTLTSIMPYYVMRIKKRSEALNNKINIQAKIAEECANQVKKQSFKLYTFLDKEDIDSVAYKTNEFLNGCKEYLNPDMTFQGISRQGAYHLWVYAPYRNYIENKIYTKLFLGQ